LSIWVTGDPVPRVAERAGSFADIIRARTGDAWTGEWATVDVTDVRVRLPAADEVAGVIITGSPARIADQLPWMRRVQGAVVGLVERAVPVLGICFGHQLLGMAFGGRSGPNPRGREIGTVMLNVLRSDPVVAGPAGFPVSMTHLDVVQELPPGARVLAATELDPYAAIRFSENAWGVQFHPEMDGSIVADYIEALRDKLLAEGIDADALLASCRDTPDAAGVLERFARRAAALRASAAV